MRVMPWIHITTENKKKPLRFELESEGLKLFIQ